MRPEDADPAAGPMPAAPELLVHKTPAYRFVRNAVDLCLRVLCGLEVQGREHLPLRGRVVLVANHQSFLDIPIVAAAAGRRHVAFVARDSLASFRPLAWLMRQCGAVLVRRGSADRAALKEMIAHLEHEDCLCVFPEGTRSEDGRVAAFRGGALIAARRARAPVVPVAIDGAFDVWPRGRRLPRRGKIRVRFGAPFDGTTGDALERAHAAVLAMLADLRSAPAPGALRADAAPVPLETRPEPSPSPPGDVVLTRSENP